MSDPTPFVTPAVLNNVIEIQREEIEKLRAEIAALTKERDDQSRLATDLNKALIECANKHVAIPKERDAMKAVVEAARAVAAQFSGVIESHHVTALEEALA